MNRRNELDISILQHYINLSLCSVLVVGIEEGDLSFKLCSSSKSVLGIDENEMLVNSANRNSYQLENIKFMRRTVSNLFSYMFDVIIFSNYLYKSKDVINTLMTSCNMLDDNGYLMIIEPNKINATIDEAQNIDKTRILISKFVENKNLKLVYQNTNDEFIILVKKY
jgi:2-polyprenyl-3-methyl-5-hydroxy-6-metoxy-1,4-benzoquinol methylase